MEKQISKSIIYNTSVEGKIIEVFKRDKNKTTRIRLNVEIFEIEFKKSHDFHLGDMLKIDCGTIINNIERIF